MTLSKPNFDLLTHHNKVIDAHERWSRACQALSDHDLKRQHICDEVDSAFAEMAALRGGSNGEALR